MNYCDLKKAKKDYNFQLNERHSKTAKKLISYRIFHNIIWNQQRKRAFKKLSDMYPDFRSTKFIRDLAKGRDTKAQYSHVYYALYKTKEMLKRIQYSPEDKNSPEFTKDKRLRVLSKAIWELESLEKCIRRDIKASENFQTDELH